MKKIYRHYKFKSLLTLARFDCTLFLHYSFVNNLGILLAFVGIFVALGIDCESEDSMILGAAIVIIGILMGGEFTAKIMDIWTINNDEPTSKK